MNSLPTIERGIPIPAARNSPTVKDWVNHLKGMKPGESFILDHQSHPANVYQAAKRAGVVIHTQKTSDGKRRVWRVKES